MAAIKEDNKVRALKSGAALVAAIVRGRLTSDWRLERRARLELKHRFVHKLKFANELHEGR